MANTNTNNGPLSLSYKDSSNNVYYASYLPLYDNNVPLNPNAIYADKIITLNNVYLPYAYDLPDYTIYVTNREGTTKWL